MLRIGIIGAGRIGKVHLESISYHVKNAVVTAIADPFMNDETRAFCEGFGVENIYTDYKKIIEDETIDAVLVCSSTDTHAPISIEAINAGKHVFCEKPDAVSVEEAVRMNEAAKKAGKLFTVHQNRRWDVDFLAIKSIIESGEIGDTINIESRVHGSRGIPSDWRCHKPYGGGMILDWGVHLIDQMLQLIPDEKIVRIYNENTNITTDEVDDGFHLMMTFESGKRATVEAGTYNFIYMPRFYMQCKNGSAYIEDWQKNCQIARLKAWNEKEVVPVQTAAGITKTMAPRDEITLDSYEIDRPKSDVHNFYRNLVKAIDGVEEQLIKLEEVRRVLLVMEGCFKSAETHQALEVNI